MFALSMQYASGYLELFSSYFRIAKENSISWSICLRTEEGPDTCYSREGRWWTDIGRRENPSWWVGENCVNWMLIIIFWRTHTPIERRSSKKSHSSLFLSCKKTIKIFPLVRSGCEISNISDMGQTNWHLQGRVNHFIFDPIIDQVKGEIRLWKATSRVSDFNRRNVMFKTALFYLLLAAFVQGEYLNIWLAFT